jgi:SagB-type dehydrogenase family enzyme
VKSQLSPDAVARLQTEVVSSYHERTKHHPNRYARALGYLDWETQPDPFRYFEGACVVPLGEVAPGPEPSYDAVFGSDVIGARPVNHTTISQLFYDSLALSAWKSIGTARWSLRVNPSSGDLHPTEGYLIAGPIERLSEQGGVYHYAPYQHALEKRFVLSEQTWNLLARDLPAGAFLVGLTSIYWRESWKYGERAFRYCQHDVGHAIAAITIAARVLGWRAVLLEQPADTSIADLLGINRQSGIEAEHPDCLIAIWPCGVTDDDGFCRTWGVSQEVLEGLAALVPAGVPNQLSEDHQPWEVIDNVSEAATKLKMPDDNCWFRNNTITDFHEPQYAALSARRIIRQRRSALAMDGYTYISRDTFYRMMQSVLPVANSAVFRVVPWRPCVHLAVFVHRVRNLAPGLYLLVREQVATELLKESLSDEFVWFKPEGCPSNVAFYELKTGDYRAVSKVVSCHQDIASDGAFSLGMLAEFEVPVSQHGAWFYKRLFWETGIIGQVLYLEAEAAGIRSTGIGCFFDDVMHRLLDIKDRQLQSLYHFTVGSPVEDPRLRSEPAYAHLAS